MPLPQMMPRPQHRRITITLELEVHGDDLPMHLGSDLAAKVAARLTEELEPTLGAIVEVAARQEPLLLTNGDVR